MDSALNRTSPLTVGALGVVQLSAGVADQVAGPADCRDASAQGPRLVAALTKLLTDDVEEVPERGVLEQLVDLVERRLVNAALGGGPGDKDLVPRHVTGRGVVAGMLVVQSEAAMMRPMCNAPRSSSCGRGRGGQSAGPIRPSC
jgi:hypothetical protein